MIPAVTERRATVIRYKSDHQSQHHSYAWQNGARHFAQRFAGSDTAPSTCVFRFRSKGDSPRWFGLSFLSLSDVVVVSSLVDNTRSSMFSRGYIANFFSCTETSST
ncbi:hypothetical protein ACJJTC_017209 [Scirpophaga incertulas]